jgi:hypothetical protein
VRLWSLHPKYLDGRGLVALWREGLLAQKVLQGKTKGYRNHPQLERFKAQRNPASTVSAYLKEVWEEAGRRGYSFDRAKIAAHRACAPIEVTRGQLDYEFQWLCSKLKTRDPARFREISGAGKIAAHPGFKVVAGPVASWEKMPESEIPVGSQMLGADCCGDL